MFAFNDKTDTKNTDFVYCKLISRISTCPIFNGESGQRLTEFFDQIFKFLLENIILEEENIALEWI